MANGELLVGVGVTAGLALGVAGAALVVALAAQNGGLGGPPQLTSYDVVYDEQGRVQTVNTMRGQPGAPQGLPSQGLPGLPG